MPSRASCAAGGHHTLSRNLSRASILTRDRCAAMARLACRPIILLRGSHRRNRDGRTF
jgi:hypothetical protein